jgi:hypothetical protein
MLQKLAIALIVFSSLPLVQKSGSKSPSPATQAGRDGASFHITIRRVNNAEYDFPPPKSITAQR